MVHEFIQNDGLRCLIKLGSDVDQNYQNYILRGMPPTYFFRKTVLGDFREQKVTLDRFILSSRAGNVVCGRHERRYRRQPDHSMAVLAADVQIPIGR